MIRRPLHFLGLGFFLVLAASCGYLLRPIPAPSVPVPNNEQLVKVTATLVDWLEHNDSEALGYDFPNPLGCKPPARPWLKKGLACVFGITYLDETTRTYTVTLDEHNIVMPRIDRSARTAALPSIP